MAKARGLHLGRFTLTPSGALLPVHPYRVHIRRRVTTRVELSNPSTYQRHPLSPRPYGLCLSLSSALGTELVVTPRDSCLFSPIGEETERGRCFLPIPKGRGLRSAHLMSSHTRFVWHCMIRAWLYLFAGPYLLCSTLFGRLAPVWRLSVFRPVTSSPIPSRCGVGRPRSGDRVPSYWSEGPVLFLVEHAPRAPERKDWVA
jgi:hypothetical protein